MDDLITKLRDEGDGIIDPFKIVESKVEKYRIHDVGDKFVNVDQLKECLTYYALANGFCNTPKSELQRNIEYMRALLHRSIAQDMRTTTK
ncbi:hypothetical protein Tco_0035261, partial [Tanacetum coccineum]